LELNNENKAVGAPWTLQPVDKKEQKGQHRTERNKKSHLQASHRRFSQGTEKSHFDEKPR
jgi:hypothetical protein